MKKLTRDVKNGIIGGVCSGLSEYFDIDVIIFRLIFILGILSTFPFILTYIILWIALPKKINTAL